MEENITSKMDYDSYVGLLKSLYVIKSDYGDWFVAPDFKHSMKTILMEPSICEEELNYADIKDILILEAARLNALEKERFNLAINWINDVITAKEIIDGTQREGTYADLIEMLKYYKKEKEEENE